MEKSIVLRDILYFFWNLDNNGFSSDLCLDMFSRSWVILRKF